MLTLRQYVTRLALVVVGLFCLLLLAPGIGTESASYGWWDAWRAKLGWEIAAEELASNPAADFDKNGIVTQEERDGFLATATRIWDQRFPRTLLALQVGITLAICGAVFQVLFRNVLATPYTLGIASGGSLGALVAIRLGWGVAIIGLSAISLSAFGGAIIVVGLVWWVARGQQRLTATELLLAGVTMGLFCSAMMMLVTAVSDERVTFTAVRWMMGSLNPIGRVAGTVMWPLLVPMWIYLIAVSRSLNQYRVGDEIAISRGVDVTRLQAGCVLACTIATAAVVSQCGPIGFVGLVVPHMVAIVFGSDCRIQIPASGLVGGGFLILCDWASQLAMRFAGWMTDRHLGSATLPIGVITAIIGVPIFLVLLRTRRRATV